MNIIPGLTVVALACPLALSAQTVTTITFDDLNPGVGNAFAPIPDGYTGLQWNGFLVLDVPLQLQLNHSAGGAANGLVSGNNVAVNGAGVPASVSGAPFNLNSAYLTAVWNNGLAVEVQGFVGTTLTYDNTYILNTTGSTFINFNYLDVDEVNFISSGGVDAGYGGHGTHFAMDNLTISTVPEPTTSALAGLGGLSLLLYRRRRA